MRLDRYQVSLDDDIEICFKRALGEEDGITQAPLFTIKKEEMRGNYDEFQALGRLSQCMIIGCISSAALVMSFPCAKMRRLLLTRKFAKAMAIDMDLMR